MKQYEEQIRKLISQMSLAEKVGQLQQCGPSLVGAFDVSFEELLNMMFDGKISREEFEKLMSTAEEDFHEEDLKAGKIGSYNGIRNAKTANFLQEIAMNETRLKIPLLFGYDVIHGYKTIMPIPLAESCAWEPELWEKTARIAAKEATAGGVNMTFAPMVDVAKDARWGRVSEGAGEDAFLTSKFGEAKVRGFQGDDLSKKDSMVACVKHFAAYGAVEAGRDYNRVDMSLQKLYEEYLPPFEACINAGARGIMPAFNDINGVPCSVNKWLLTDLLRDTWGFDGITVSDANAIAECVNHGIAKDKKDASQKAITAGMEIDMTSNSYSENLKDLVESGQVDEKYLDKAVADVLRVKFELGLFDNPFQTTEAREKEELLKPEYRSIAREAAGKSMVLLKNQEILPLKRGIKVAIVGDLAINRGEMTGAWAIGADENICISIVDACKQQNIDYVYTAGHHEKIVNQNDLLNEIEGCEIVVVAMGEVKDQSGEAASRAEIGIPEYQKEVLEVLLKSEKPIVAVLFNGRPLALPAVMDKIPAILEAWHPGAEAGNAILDLLFGEINPSAKLTTTFPYATGQCPVYYAAINTGRPGGRGKFTSKYLDTPLNPSYPFGYGLSYTTYQYENLNVKKTEEAFVANLRIINTGERDGYEIVQCYIRDLVAQRVRPVKQLKAFKKVFLKAKEEKIVTFQIPFVELGYYGLNMEYIVEKGEFEIFVGKNSAEGLTSTIEL